MGQNRGITIFGITIFPVQNDEKVVDEAQNISDYNDKINFTDRWNANIVNIV